MQHLFHQQQFPSEWSQGHHQHPNHHAAQQAQQAQAQAQAAAVAAAAAQHQHYNRIASSNGTTLPSAGAIPRGPANDLTQLSGEVGMTEENRRVLDWIAQLMKPATRETALLELSKKREQVPELALILWHSFGECTLTKLHKRHAYNPYSGVMASLLQEIISVYPLLNPSQLTAAASNRVCNALALLQCVASHTETRGLFLSGIDSLLFARVFR